MLTGAALLTRRRHADQRAKAWNNGAMRVEIPDRLVVFTFDDGKRSNGDFVAPLLERHGFGATFFISEGLGFEEDKDYFLTWEEIRGLHDRGFEIGNHTRRHLDVNTLGSDQLAAELEHIDRRCAEIGIPRPQTFCYPGYHTGRQAVAVLAEHGFAWARGGCEPTPADGYQAGGCGPAYDPLLDHPLLVPTTANFGPDVDLAALTWAAQQARAGRAAVITFHGVPDPRHPWVSTEPQTFRDYLSWLQDGGYTVTALRDLSRYVTVTEPPADPYAAQRQRRGTGYGPGGRTG